MSAEDSSRDGNHFDLGELLAGTDASALGPGEEGAGFRLADAFVCEGGGKVSRGVGRRCDPAAGTPGQGIGAPVTWMGVQCHDVEKNHRFGWDDVGAVANGQLLTVSSSIFWDHQYGRKES